MNNRILIAIKTAANNYIQRQIVRQTWLIEVKEHHIPYVFVLGSTNDEKLIDEILDEDNIYNDLLIGKPVDNYYNLTLKAMFIFAWTKVHCPSRWLFYVDDDTIINAQQVIDFISLRKNVLNRVLYCHMGQHFARRNPQSKWFVPMSIWEPALYPKYCQGWGWLIPPNVLSLLHDTSISNLTEPKLWIDDVFMTGIVAEVAGIELIESPMACCGRRDSELYEKSLLLAQMANETDTMASISEPEIVTFCQIIWSHQGVGFQGSEAPHAMLALAALKRLNFHVYAPTTVLNAYDHREIYYLCKHMSEGISWNIIQHTLREIVQGTLIPLSSRSYISADGSIKIK
ncbi:unnamed protein product [Adineta steineri]|uniref:Hexosyltransferase n=1 Tax=Adineta steineri TaxID=433720 RepID=A0A819NLS6_9BILA|nr:unnamed protein product [Adineta steineri]CAF4001143.1 unnamed protein product [Adineta steineri]